LRKRRAKFEVDLDGHGTGTERPARENQGNGAQYIKLSAKEVTLRKIEWQVFTVKRGGTKPKRWVTRPDQTRGVVKISKTVKASEASTTGGNLVGERNGKQNSHSSTTASRKESEVPGVF